MGAVSVAAQRKRRRGTAGAAAIALLAIASAGTWTHLERRTRTSLPGAAAVDVLPLYVDDTPVPLTVYAGDAIAPWTASADDVATSPVLWQRMHLANWNVVPPGLRSTALANMLLRYRHVLIDPPVWDTMTAADWDVVPQPVRTVAFRNMTAYWSGYYAVGREYDLPRRLVADTLSAILMSESWFDHRAVSSDSLTGNRDIGLAQASTFARARMRELHAAAALDVAYEDDEYVNPWKATRFLAIWCRLLLDEARGDLDVAIGAYHRGISRALDQRGRAYIEMVHRRRHRFIRNQDAPPAWNEMWMHGRMLEEQAWPWIGRADLNGAR